MDLMTRRRLLKTIQSASPESGLTEIELTATQEYARYGAIYNWVSANVPSTAWYWFAVIEMDLTDAPATNNQFISMMKCNDTFGISVRYNSGTYQQNIGGQYNSAAYVANLSVGQKIKVIYQSGVSLAAGTWDILGTSFAVAVTKIRSACNTAAQLKPVLDTINQGLQTNIINMDHNDTSNYVYNQYIYSYVATDGVAGGFGRFRDDTFTNVGNFSQNQVIVLSAGDVLVSILKK